MNHPTRQAARDAVNARPLTDFMPLLPTPKAGRDMFVCPVCGSGKGRNRTGAFHLYRDTNRVICFSSAGCFGENGEDTLGALRIIWSLSEDEVLDRVGETFIAGHTEQQKSQKADYTSFYRQAHETLKTSPEALEYLHGRGISDESIDRFKLGFCSTWRHPSSPNSTPTRRIIIPRTAESYTARMIDTPKNEWEEARKKQVTRQKALFNAESLEGAETVIVCEGELDCISLIQAGAAAAVGIGCVGNTGIMLEAAKKHPTAIYILALDADEDKENGTNPGKDAQKRLARGMRESGIRYTAHEPSQLYRAGKDANEELVKAPDRLRKLVQWLEEEAQTLKADLDEEQIEDLTSRTGAEMLDLFLLSVQKKDFKPIPTGIYDLDRALCGGFVRGTLATLGAMPGMGKTLLAQWIFENIAKSGQDCLFMNLEMSREQLIARSLSRMAWMNRESITPIEVLRGYAWTDAQRAIVTAAADRFRPIAEHLVYNPDGCTNSIDSILQAIQAETTRLKAHGKPAPLCCIDYLQIIDSGKRDAMEGLKDVIFRLKDYAKRESTVILLIIANNRTANRAGVVNMESGRDTSAIEYSADIALGLEFAAISEGREVDGQRVDLDKIRKMRAESAEQGAEIPAICTEITLKVMKNRFGQADRRIKLIFDGSHSTFTQVCFDNPFTS